MKRFLILWTILGAAFVQTGTIVPIGAQSGSGSIRRLDPAVDQLISPQATVEKLGDGLRFAEGPVWVRNGGYLLFSDIPGNAIMKWTPDSKDAKDSKLSIFRRPVFAGTFPDGAQAGSNGLTLDRQGRLIAAEHGNRRVSRTEKDGSIIVLADRYEGKRLNSPNDVVVKKNGDIYFTDPPYGLRSMLGPALAADPRALAEAKELDFNGVFRISHGKIRLLVKDIPNPNGLAFSPDEKILYICNSDPMRRVWWAYAVKLDGTLGPGRVFADLTKEPGMGVPDGMKVDKNGNIFSSGPAGVVILSPEGKHLGTIQFPEQPANLAWGDFDGKSLYVTARTGLYRVKTNTEGIRP